MVQASSSFIPRSIPPIDEAFLVNANYINDTDPRKVNLGIGVYRTEEGLPWPLPAVEQAEQILRDRKDVTRHEYLPIQGDQKFLDLSRDLAFDLTPEDDPARKRIVSVQTVSGTGANHVGAKYLSNVLRPRCVWLPDPTWINHFALWEYVGVEVKTYPYYDPVNRNVNFSKMADVLENEARAGDVVLFHVCAHNPSGCDPSPDEWLQLVELCSSRGLVPFLDFAYQGFASGDVSKDAWAVKCFLSKPEMQFCVAHSFSKNFGLYGQRAGALHVVVSEEVADAHAVVLANLCHITRSEISMAPRGGSDVVRCVLEDSMLRDQWKRDLLVMSERIRNMRRALYDELIRLRTPGLWNHIVDQVGMFSYTGLSKAEVSSILAKYHVHMLRSGRISMSGVTGRNVTYIAKAIDDVVRLHRLPQETKAGLQLGMAMSMPCSRVNVAA